MTKIDIKIEAYHGNEPCIFVSYVRKDKDIVYPIIRRLRDKRYRIWFDKGIPWGEEWEKEVKKYLQQCAVFLIFVSKKAQRSRYVKRELIAAEYQGKKIFSVYIDIKPEELSKDFICLKQLNGIELKNLQARGQFDKFTSELGEKPRSTIYDVDAELLGLGYLPTTKDVIDGVVPLDRKKQLKRQEAIVRDMIKKKTISGIDGEYVIPDVFQLTSEVANAAEKLSAVNRRQSKLTPTNLLHRKLTIKKSYVAPLRLLTGLVSRFHENWPPIVEAYSRLAGSRPGTLDDIHYYIEFCWVSWGPSVETTSLIDDPETTFMVAQVATGDEANSVPLIMEKKVWREHFHGDFRRQQAQVRTSGRPMELSGLEIVNPGKDQYFSKLRNHPLFKDFFDGTQIALYLSSDAANVTPPKAVEEDKPFYSTAYLWLMLEQVAPKSSGTLGGKLRNYSFSSELEPGKVLPFFEHANLACKETLDFLRQCLARKAIYHVLKCAKMDVYYRYATALFDEEMAEVLEKEKSLLHEKDQQIVNLRLAIPPKKQRRRPEEVCTFVERLLSRVSESLDRKKDPSSADRGRGLT